MFLKTLFFCLDSQPKKCFQKQHAYLLGEQRPAEPPRDLEAHQKDDATSRIHDHGGRAALVGEEIPKQEKSDHRQRTENDHARAVADAVRLLHGVPHDDARGNQHQEHGADVHLTGKQRFGFRKLINF